MNIHMAAIVRKNRRSFSYKPCLENEHCFVNDGQDINKTMLCHHNL
jgi:hypothetical protein